MSTLATAAVSGYVPLAEALRSFELFDGLTEEELDWFVEHSSDVTFEEGSVLVREGDEAVYMSIVIDGQMRYQSSQLGSPVYVARPGVATGLLPYSRMRYYPGTGHALTRLRIATLHRDHFPEMLRRIPPMAPRLISMMADRIRETTRLQEQRQKLTALGKLAAGLAHELNNPASAALRSAEDLRHWSRLLQDSNQHLADAAFDAAQFRCVLEIERKLIESTEHTEYSDLLERSDREESLALWLRSLDISKAWELAPVLVEAGVTKATLQELMECFGSDAREPAITRLAATLMINRLTRGIQASTHQISELVRAVKGYSFVDQAPEQEIDINTGIDNTISVLGSRIAGRIRVVRQFDENLPRVTANGGELNQVWTNLIDNALDAMDGNGTLRLHTACEPGMVLVEIADTGIGIPPENSDKIFDPFFTTKDVGAGSGLGLDVVFQVVQKHRGDVRFTSRPGDTVFQVRLPVHNFSAF